MEILAIILVVSSVIKLNWPFAGLIEYYIIPGIVKAAGTLLDIA